MAGHLVEAGRALIRLREDVRMIVLPQCAYCRELAPLCRCGEPRRGGKP